MPGWLMDELRAYIKANRIPSNQPIFNISPVTAWAVAKSLGHKIHKDVYPHLFRHSRAIDLAEKTGRETIVQRHLGHRSSATTQIYFRFIEEKKAAEVVKSLNEKPKAFHALKNKPIGGKAN
jgi:integrase